MGWNWNESLFTLISNHFYQTEMILRLNELVGRFCPELEPRGCQQFQSRGVKAFFSRTFKLEINCGILPKTPGIRNPETGTPDSSQGVVKLGHVHKTGKKQYQSFTNLASKKQKKWWEHLRNSSFRKLSIETPIQNSQDKWLDMWEKKKLLHFSATV